MASQAILAGMKFSITGTPNSHVENYNPEDVTGVNFVIHSTVELIILNKYNESDTIT